MRLISSASGADKRTSPWLSTAKKACAGTEFSNNSALIKTLVSKTARTLVFEQVVEGFWCQTLRLRGTADLTHHFLQRLARASHLEQAQAKQKLQLFALRRRGIAKGFCCLRCDLNINGLHRRHNWLLRLERLCSKQGGDDKQLGGKVKQL